MYGKYVGYGRCDSTYSSQTSRDWPKLYSDTLVAAFVSHGLTTLVRKALVPCCSNIDASREDRHEVSVTDTNWGILQTLPADAETRNATGLANALLLLPSRSWAY